MSIEIPIQSEIGTEHNDNIQAWVTANGVSPHKVPIDSFAEVDPDNGEVSFTVFVLNLDGSRVLDYPHGEPVFRKDTLTVPLLAAPEAFNL